MPPVEVQTEGQLGQRATTSRALALPLGKARLEACFEAGDIPVATVEDAPFGVDQEGLEQPVLLDVGDPLLSTGRDRRPRGAHLTDRVAGQGVAGGAGAEARTCAGGT